ncbi:FAD-dependent oxidoreductase [Variovorax sp. PAMC 28711]|uniref:FAD-dependent oxidoreductase n=1 Tax=Variovorax sp. PAMC 28711 TaxID=1795631 RepID=UPI00078EF60F|nr:FAD-dependent oxidoreductase [Variovorax sp. PAMC 28711]AMM26728.1 fumarate reductase [Variovorax sp. PAMC 28711]
MKRRDFLAVTAGTLALAGCEAPAPIEGGFTGIDLARGHALRDRTLRGAAPDTVRRTRVVVAGGGVAGLAAARALRLAGVEDFVLLELEDTAGGNSRGGSVAGIACPLGAHYLPVPGDEASEVQDLLEELGLRRRVAGRWEYDERHLCHSPQERIFFRGEWQDGLLPVQGVDPSTLAQYRLFARRVETLQREAHFQIPMAKLAPTPALLALDALTFDAWLAREGLDDPHLRWYLDYCCRDDYGAGLAHVSAWAGIHYFASRHGFHAPGDDNAERDSVLTWPEGNGWLTRQLAEPLGDRLKRAHAVTRIAESRTGIEVDAFDVATQTTVRWQAERCIVALPVFIAARVIENPPEVLRHAAAHLRYAPWLVANVHIRAPLADNAHGAARSWDNVVYGTRGLGYVDARHQTLDPTPAATVLSWYRPLGPSTYDMGDGRRQLLERPWAGWRDELLAELSVPHPELPALATRVDITRYGHAMAMPAPGLLRQLGSQPAPATVAAGRLAFAHADWSGYSVFEEAFTRGHLAGSIT